MPMTFNDDQVVIDDVAGIDDAEALFDWLQRHPQAAVDLSSCVHLHAACLQALMAARARIRTFPADSPFAAWLRTALTLSTEESRTP